MQHLVDVDGLRDTLDLPQSVSDAELADLAAAVDGFLLPRLTPGVDHTRHPQCREAALGMAVQVWASRRAPGGQMVTTDLGPAVAPHLLGPGLVARFGGLLGLCLAVGRGPVIA